MKPATSIEKVCRVLDALRSRPSLGVTEIAHKTRLLPSDAHRIVKSLENFGYVEQDPYTKKYRLGLELLKLGHLVHQRMELREVAKPFMRHLSELAEATANLAVLDRRELEVIFVEQVDSPSEFQIRLRIGARVSPHATSVGKVLLAHAERATVEQLLQKHGLPKKTRNTITEPARLEDELEAVRSLGYAVDREEAVQGACCIGAPVREHTGEVLAAVSISMMAARMSHQDEPRLVSLVKGTAAKISVALGYQPSSSQKDERPS